MEKLGNKFTITWIMLVVIGFVSAIMMHNMIPGANNLQIPDDSEVLIGSFIYSIMYSIVMVFNSKKHPIRSYVFASLPCYLWAILMVVNVASLENIIRAVLIVVTMIIAAVQIKKENKVSQQEGCS